MRIEVDRARCITSGMCTSIAPEIFEIDDDALSILQEEPPPELLEQVESAVACCPVEALSLREE